MDCRTPLKATEYCCLNDDEFYCKTHYNARFLAGGYSDQAPPS